MLFYFQLNICFLAVALARPDVSHLPEAHHYSNQHLGGHYQIPSTNYGVPLVNNYGEHVHHSNVHYSDGHHSDGHHSGAHLSGAHLSDAHHSNAHLGGAQHSGVYHSGVHHSGVHHSGAPSQVFLPNYNEHSQYVSHGRDYGVHHHYPSQTTQVTYDRSADYGKDHYYSGEKVDEEKHVYFYSAPDVSENRPRLKVHIVPHHKKNTNVLYVKVPDYVAPIPEVDAPASHVDEKTKVYVLVKDAKEYAPVVFNAPAPVKTSHPELYVVPYKNEHDVEKAIAEDSHGHIHGAAVGHQYNDETSFVKSINTESHNAYIQNDKYSNVHPDGSLDYYARTAPAVSKTYVRFGEQGSDHPVTSHSLGTHHVETHNVHHEIPHFKSGEVKTSQSLGAHHVDTHNVHHEIPHYGSDQVKTHHVVTSLVPNTQVGTHSHTVHTLGGPVVESSGVQHNARVSEGSVSVSPLHSIVSSPAPGSSVSYSEHSVTPGFGSNFVSSTVPTIHAN